MNANEKLINEFMGYEFKPANHFISWERVRPVVDKINQIAALRNDIPEYLLVHLRASVAFDSIYHAYGVSVEIIKWYNKNKIKNKF